MLWESSRSKILGVATEGPYSLMDIRVGKFLEAGFLLIVPVTPSRSKLITTGHDMLFGHFTFRPPLIFEASAHFIDTFFYWNRVPIFFIPQFYFHYAIFDVPFTHYHPQWHS